MGEQRRLKMPYGTEVVGLLKAVWMTKASCRRAERYRRRLAGRQHALDLVGHAGPEPFELG